MTTNTAGKDILSSGASTVATLNPGWSILDYNNTLNQLATPQKNTPGGSTVGAGGGMSTDQRNALFKQQTGGNIAPVGWNPSYFDAAAEAERQRAAAELQGLNTQFDQNSATLSDQLPYLGQQKDSALGSLDTELTGVKNQVGSAKASEGAQADQNIQDAGSIASSTQLQNRNVLRALGIINSTAAGDLLTKPMNEFGKIRANVQAAVSRRFTELDDFLNTQTAKHQQAVTDIQNNYAQLVGNIQRDLRFNERQRADAVRSANAALSQRLADIQGSLLNYNNQVSLLKQQTSQQAGQVLQNTLPNFGAQSVQNTSLSTPTQNQAGVNIYTDPTKRNNQISANSLSG